MNNTKNRLYKIWNKIKKEWCSDLYLLDPTGTIYGYATYEFKMLSFKDYTFCFNIFRNDNKKSKEYPEGQPIYEGDIVQGIDRLTGGYIFGYIDFDNSSFMIKNELTSRYRWLDYDIEVIGNIYDNPQLMDELWQKLYEE